MYWIREDLQKCIGFGKMTRDCTKWQRIVEGLPESYGIEHDVRESTMIARNIKNCTRLWKLMGIANIYEIV